MCNCIHTDFGSFDRQVSMKCPFIKKNNGWVCIDICICQEIAELWHDGVKTLASCCGHNKVEGTIAVDKNSIDKMYELGYELSSEKFDDEIKNQVFKAKSIGIEDKYFLRGVAYSIKAIEELYTRYTNNIDRF